MRLALWAWLAGAAWGQGLPAVPEHFERFVPENRAFSCEMPLGWTVFEEEGLRGPAVRMTGPEQADGAWRAVYQVHLLLKDRPGYAPLKDFLKAETRRDKRIAREATVPAAWRVAKKPARIFEVREARFTPPASLPAARLGMHHFYALIPASRDDYFLVKLSTTEDSYLKYRDEFKRFLESFQILSY